MKSHSFLAFALSLPLTVFAAEPAKPGETIHLDRYTVTAASGITESVANIPQSIELVSPLKSAQIQPIWIGEIMNQLPGVFFANLRGPTDAPAIRMPVSYDNTELYLQDGLPLQSAISHNHGAFANSSALTSFGGIEVLKGPGTALHGSDAFAAVINVMSLAPTDTLSGNVRAAVGSYGATEVRGEVSTGFAGSQAFRVAASYAREDSWRDTTGWDRAQTIARHRWKSDTTEINTILTLTDFNSEQGGSQTLAVFNSNPRSDGLAPAVPRDQALNPVKYLRLSSELTHILSPRFTVQITPYYRDIDASFMAVWEAAVVPVISEKTVTAALVSRLYADWSKSSQTVFGFDVDETQLDNLKVQVLPAQVVFGQVYPQGRHYDFTVNYRNLAPYIQHTQRLSETFTLVAGLRYEEATYDYDNHLTSGAHDAFFRPADRTDRFDALNPKLGLTWQLERGQSLFTRYAHGFRIPMAESLYMLNSSQTAFELKPEQIDSYEIGYRGAFGPAVSVTLAAYYMKSRDGLTTGVFTPAGTITANGGVREYRGIEGQLVARLSDEWSLTLAAAVQDSKILRDRPDGTDPRGVNGKTPNSQPSRLANLGLTWTPGFAGRRLTFNYDLQLLGSWWIDDQNTLKTPDVFISGLRARYALDRQWTLTAKVLNLFDRHYAMTAADGGFGPSYRPGNPITVSGGVEFAW